MNNNNNSKVNRVEKVEFVRKHRVNNSIDFIGLKNEK